MEGFENSSFTRPSGGVFDVKLAQNSKNEKVVCGSLLEFHRHRISSLIKRWTREQSKERWMTEAMQVKRWISEHVKARWMLNAFNWRRDGCYMRWTEGVMDVSSDGSWRNPSSDWSGSKLLIKMQALLVGDQAMDQWTIKGWMVDGSENNWRIDGWIREQ